MHHAHDAGELKYFARGGISDALDNKGIGCSTPLDTFGEHEPLRKSPQSLFMGCIESVDACFEFWYEVRTATLRYYRLWVYDLLSWCTVFRSDCCAVAIVSSSTNQSLWMRDSLTILPVTRCEQFVTCMHNHISGLECSIQWKCCSTAGFSGVSQVFT